MSTVDQLSSWILGIYEDKALGAKVLKSIIDVLPTEYEQAESFEVSLLCPAIAYIKMMIADNWTIFCIHLEEDVDVNYENEYTIESVTVLKYPLSLIK
jgi:hypothetical protein